MTPVRWTASGNFCGITRGRRPVCEREPGPAAVILLQIVRDNLGVGIADRSPERLDILVTSASHKAALGNGEFITM